MAEHESTREALARVFGRPVNICRLLELAYPIDASRFAPSRSFVLTGAIPTSWAVEAVGRGIASVHVLTAPKHSGGYLVVGAPGFERRIRFGPGSTPTDELTPIEVPSLGAVIRAVIHLEPFESRQELTHASLRMKFRDMPGRGEAWANKELAGLVELWRAEQTDGEEKGGHRADQAAHCRDGRGGGDFRGSSRGDRGIRGAAVDP